MSKSKQQTSPAEEKEAPAVAPRAKRRGGTGVIFLILLVLFALWYTGAVSINRLYRQIGDLEYALEETRSGLAAASEEAERLRSELGQKADREELPAPRFADAELIVKAIAHRGYSEEAPENTLPAFRLALEKGFGYVETDIRFTADGVAVCLHDDTVDRTSDGSGAIAHMSLEEARQLDFGAWKGEAFAGTRIPTAEEFLGLCRALGLRPYMELKTGSQEQIRALVDLVRSFGMADHVTWISFSYDLLRHVSRYDPAARLGLLVTEPDRNAVMLAGYLLTGKNRVFLDAMTISEETCRLCREADIPLEAWTVDETDAVLSMDPYVSGVTSDSLIAGQVLSDAFLAGSG